MIFQLLLLTLILYSLSWTPPSFTPSNGYNITRQCRRECEESSMNVTESTDTDSSHVFSDVGPGRVCFITLIGLYGELSITLAKTSVTTLFNCNLINEVGFVFVVAPRTLKVTSFIYYFMVQFKSGSQYNTL